jgi:Cullin family
VSVCPPPEQDPERTKDPVEFVARLLSEKDKYDRIISQAFSHDKTFQNALNLSFEHFINLNSRSPEYISLFMDDKLRKGLKARSCCSPQTDRQTDEERRALPAFFAAESESTSLCALCSDATAHPLGLPGRLPVRPSVCLTPREGCGSTPRECVCLSDPACGVRQHSARVRPSV